MRELEEAREYETDELLVAYVKVQHLTERIHQMNQTVDLDGDGRTGLPGKVPAGAYAHVFSGELDGIRASLSKSLRQNSKFPSPHPKTYSSL